MGYSSSFGYISKVNPNLMDYCKDYTITSAISMSVLQLNEYNVELNYTFPSPNSPSVVITDITGSINLNPTSGSQILNSNTIIYVNIQDQS